MMDGLSLSTLFHHEIKTFINILDFFLTLKRSDPIFYSENKNFKYFEMSFMV